MVQPDLEILVDWRDDGLNYVLNDDFEDDTSGWSTSAGIASAATSITQDAGGYVGNFAGRVVTTATNGSGVKYDFGSTTFTSGRTYRFRLFAQAVSGTTAAKMIIGSLGTGSDRATTTMTLTGQWIEYAVNWTPSGTRTDVEAVVANNAASAMTAKIDHVEVWETIDDVTPYAEYLTITRGANFDGSQEAPGQCTIRLLNIDKRFSPDNASSPLTGLVKLGRKVFVRASHSDINYGQFYGLIRRIVPRPTEGLVEIICEDPLYLYGRQEVSIALSLDTSIAAFRFLVLVELGDALRWWGAIGVEDDIVYTEADQRNALGLLTELNQATGSVHFILPQWSTNAPYYYRVLDRATVQSQAVDETFNDDINGMANYDLTDEGLVNSQRVFPTARRVADSPEVVWEGNVPFTIDTTTTVWAGRKSTTPVEFERGRHVEDIEFSDPTFDQELVSDGTGFSSIDFTPFSRSAKIVINTATTAEITTLHITGRPARRLSDESVVVEDLSVIPDRYAGSDITSEFIGSLAMAQGLASWWVFRYKGGVTRPDVTYVNRFPTLLSRNIGDRVALNFATLGVSAKEFLIRSITLTIDQQGKEWTGTYSLESIPTALNLFTIGGTADQGIGGTAILGY
jgi:hypothetical protein